MSVNGLERLLRLAARTQDHELSCTECFDVLPHYVELEVVGAAPERQLPLFRQHLEQCGVCREEYETVRELARLEAEGRSPVRRRSPPHALIRPAQARPR